MFYIVIPVVFALVAIWFGWKQQLNRLAWVGAIEVVVFTLAFMAVDDRSFTGTGLLYGLMFGVASALFVFAAGAIAAFVGARFSKDGGDSLFGEQ